MTEKRKDSRLSDLDRELFEAVFGSRREHERRRLEHEELMRSPEFVAASRRLERITKDLAETLRHASSPPRAIRISASVHSF
jgi:hypothetical protein